MNFEDFRKAVVAAAEKLGVTEYELYYSGGEDVSASAFRGEINQFGSSVDGGVCLRCVHAGKLGYASTENLSAGEAESLVRRAMSNAETVESDEAAVFVPGGQTYEAHETADFALPEPSELVKTALEIQEMLRREDSAVTESSRSAAAAGTSTVAIFNSRGLDVSFTAKNAMIMAMPIVTDGTEMVNAYEVDRGDFSKLDREKVVRKSVENAKAKLGGGVPKTGAVPIVFSPDAMGAILATFASSFSSEMAQKGLSALAGKEGETVAAPCVTLCDDPFYKDSPMPVPFDAEGSPAHRKNVIENGKLLTLLYNLQTAAKAGRETTGNAAKSGYASKIGVQPFTMYLAPGALSEEELLEKAGEGVYINMVGGLHAGANPISGDFSLQSGGFLIEGGKKTAPVKSFTVAGNFFGLLKGIAAVGSNIELAEAHGITNFASPSVLVEGLTVAGK